MGPCRPVSRVALNIRARKRKKTDHVAQYSGTQQPEETIQPLGTGSKLTFPESPEGWTVKFDLTVQPSGSLPRTVEDVEMDDGAQRPSPRKPA